MEDERLCIHNIKDTGKIMEDEAEFVEAKFAEAEFVEAKFVEAKFVDAKFVEAELLEYERLYVDIDRAIRFMIVEDEAELNVFEVHSKAEDRAKPNRDGCKVYNKPEDVVAMKKEKAEHLDIVNFKVVQGGVINRGDKDSGKIMEDEAISFLIMEDEAKLNVFEVHRFP